MIVVAVDEISVLMQWALAAIRRDLGDTLNVPSDFYWRPEEIRDLFVMDRDVANEGVGSLVDEIDLLRKSIIHGDGIDLPDIVLERLAYLLLAISTSFDRHGPEVE